MKKTLKLLSLVSIILFGILKGMSIFFKYPEFNTLEIRNLLVFIYLVASIFYFRIELNEKNALIEKLRKEIEENSCSKTKSIRLRKNDQT
jgi:hypothetical protein